MGLCSLTHQIDALNILNELQAHATTSNRDGEGQCSGALLAGKEAVRPGELTKEPRRLKTITARARESCLARLLEILTRLISIEEDFIKDASYGRRLLKRKDSVDLKNICLRMAIAESGSHSDRDLRELRHCLRLIVGNLLAYVLEENNPSSTETTHKLRELSNSFPDI
ncbi:leukemia-associated protein 7-like [Sinocyclocheilus grahami]|uniref:Leukemia-associated protein 7-like n=1 Tax=Sinocyclocheilus grahami TaxID=75366 RepID=A0A672Q3H4_SINGR|nr:PREDICTED: leukemia-associated protein 7-like [Sinocyclocheilus grahami]XP_016151224.1 PREDICTED: leukemia-associated protein 7-like [Sinocyclocheilus grahami]